MKHKALSREESVRILYEIEQLPVFQNIIYDASLEAINCPKGDIRLVENLKTGLVYNKCFKPELMRYDDRYQNEQAVSPSFREHLWTVMQIIANTMGRESLVEVGCGKGFFLEMLLDEGFDVRGFDPTYEGSNSRIIKEYFSSNFSIRADGLILRHVLEHIQDPVEFLMQLKTANGVSGKIYIEVPCFEWICQQRAWFDVFYEHVNYFKLSDFYRMFDVVYDSGRLFGNQYIYVVAELSSLKVPVADENERTKFPEDFLAGVIDQGKENKKSKVVVWGGSSKGVIFSLIKQRMGQPVSIVVDINPAKQGKYLPATGIKVKSPKELISIPRGSTIFVMNSNYLQEIKDMSGDKFKYVICDG